VHYGGLVASEKKMLQEELRTFEQHKEKWLRTNPGDFVVIAERVVAGFYPDYESAFRAGLQRFGVAAEFLVKQVCAEDPVYLIY
jgi:hypothetical protein